MEIQALILIWTLFLNSIYIPLRIGLLCCCTLQASGVAVSEEVKSRYDEIKKKKNHRYLVFFIKDEKTISVEKVGEGQWVQPVLILVWSELIRF